MYESLHNHTTTSDGLESHLAVLETARRYGVTTVAFTDHDALPDTNTLEQLKSYQGEITWSVGIEVSSGAPVNEPSVGGLHIVGLFVDAYDVALREHCVKAQVARQERMQRIVENLTGLGFVISEADCLQASGGESVGRPHIVSALLKYPKNHKLLIALRNRMAVDAVASTAYRAMEERVRIRGIEEYVYSLLLVTTAYIPDVYVDYLYQLSMEESVTLIRSAGGVALLAHWWCYAHKLPLEALRGYLIAGHLDGIEIIGGSSEESLAAYPALKALSEETGCLASVGADAHRPEDYARYVAMTCIKDTTGVFRNLHERVHPIRAFTNYLG